MSAPLDFASISSGAGQAVGQGLQAQGQYAKTKEEKEELKRRILANLLNQAVQRDLSMYQATTAQEDRTSANQGDALQEMARGFADSLRSATLRGRV